MARNLPKVECQSLVKQLRHTEGKLSAGQLNYAGWLAAVRAVMLGAMWPMSRGSNIDQSGWRVTC